MQYIHYTIRDAFKASSYSKGWITLRKKIALFLSFIFIFTLAVPFQGFAAQMDKELENAIKIAKTKFQIPENYKFTSSISTSGTKKVYYLSWRSPETVDSASINVSIDEKGTITSYNKYSAGDYTKTSKLPKLSRQEAKAKADAYIEGIQSGLLKNLQYRESGADNIMDTSYYLYYFRVFNGVPYYNDSVTVSVNRETGALQEYSRQWSDNLTFPQVNSPITVNKAEEAYSKNLGLRLIYKTSTTDDVLKAYPVYVPIYDNGQYGIDAVTGERQRLLGNYFYGFNEAAMKSSAQATAMDAGGQVQLNPDELKAVQEAALLKSKDEVEKIARASKFLDIPAGHKLQSYYLSTNWPERSEYVWSLQFSKQTDDSSRYIDHISATINAKTGVITSFYKGSNFAEGAKPKEDIAAVKAKADAFLAEYYPQYVKELVYDKLASESHINTTDKNETYNLTYSRLVNGIAYPDNGVNINYDNVNGLIIGFNLNWYNISFPSVEKVIGIDAASRKLFDKVGLGLEYKHEYVDTSKQIAWNGSELNTKVLLVYSLKPNKPLIIDANTGDLLSNDGKVYKEAVRISYTDIKGHHAEKEIMVLAENGIYLEGTEFKPKSPITQKDFLTLVSKTLSYYGPIITPRSTDKEIDELYAYLTREGIIKAGEKAPESSVTREEAVKFLIRALKFDKVADIKGIYNLTFKDKASINQALTGYVAIAAGLGIIDGKSDSFRPKEKLTRGDSAIMIYNYLQS